MEHAGNDLSCYLYGCLIGTRCSELKPIIAATESNEDVQQVRCDYYDEHDADQALYDPEVRVYELAEAHVRLLRAHYEVLAEGEQRRQLDNQLDAIQVGDPVLQQVDAVVPEFWLHGVLNSQPDGGETEVNEDYLAAELHVLYIALVVAVVDEEQHLEVKVVYQLPPLHL